MKITLCLPLTLLAVCLWTIPTAVPLSARPTADQVERVTTIAPFPRGLAIVDDALYVLSRGRVRGAGGVSAAVEDQAGTLWRVDPNLTEPANGPLGEAVKKNGVIVALPTAPPFHLWERTASPPEADTRTDRPYCTLRWHEPTQSFYLCAFSGIDKYRTAEDPIAFSKNRTDGLLRYDTRTGKWHEVERHREAAGERYPHHDVFENAPPHGLLNGPDNCLPVGRWLYAVAKDNSALAVYDLAPLMDDPEAGYPEGWILQGERVYVKGQGWQVLKGHSALAERDGYLYIATRTSSVVYRVPLREDGLPVQPMEAEIVAYFDPFDPETFKSADITDMDFDPQGRLYVVSAKPSRLYRFVPDPASPFDARGGAEEPWADMATLTGNQKMKSENVMVHDGWAYVTSGDGYTYQKGAAGTVYRVPIEN
ncbi:MAG: hypothetical protein RLY93_11790 [Sumerlaeia bacterium]